MAKFTQSDIFCYFYKVTLRAERPNFVNIIVGQEDFPGERLMSLEVKLSGDRIALSDLWSHAQSPIGTKSVKGRSFWCELFVCQKVS